MNQDQPSRSAPSRGSKPLHKPDRLAREAAALRANLHKRKQQARQRAEFPEVPEPKEPGHTS